MSDLFVDLTNFKEKTSARVEPGRYIVQVDDLDVTKSKAGNLMWEVHLRIVGGEFDGSILLERLTHSDRALFRVVGFLQALGIPTKKKKMKLTTDHLLGKKLEVDVEDGEPYQGKVKSEVRGFNKLSKSQESKKKDDFEGLEDDDTQEPEETPEKGNPDKEPEGTETEETSPEETSSDSKESEKADGDDGEAEEVDLDEVEL